MSELAAVVATTAVEAAVTAEHKAMVVGARRLYHFPGQQATNLTWREFTDGAAQTQLQKGKRVVELFVRSQERKEL